MHKQRVLSLGAALVIACGGLSACDDRGSGNLAGISNTGNGSAALTLLPTDVQITVGSTTQLTTNAGTSTSLQWASSNNNVATVSATGEVTGRSVGTTVITVRFATDTANAATSNISVTQ